MAEKICVRQNLFITLQHEYEEINLYQYIFATHVVDGL